MAILEVHHIEKHFGATRVLEDISFDLEQGQALAIIGSSGSREKLISSRTRVLPNRFWISSTCKIAMLCAPLKPGNSPASSRCGSGPGPQCR